MRSRRRTFLPAQTLRYIQQRLHTHVRSTVYTTYTTRRTDTRTIIEWLQQQYRQQRHGSQTENARRQNDEATFVPVRDNVRRNASLLVRSATSRWSTFATARLRRCWWWTTITTSWEHHGSISALAVTGVLDGYPNAFVPRRRLVVWFWFWFSAESLSPCVNDFQNDFFASGLWKGMRNLFWMNEW
jgi:hypothetical protein